MILSTPFYVLLGAAFLIGSIPTAYIFVKKIKGVDIRSIGSGNVGATNASRALGRPMGLLVLCLDALKGLIPTFFGTWILTKSFPWNIATPEEQAAAVLLGLAAFLGHCFTPWLGFRGGKGVATGLGVYLVLAPYAALTTLAICVIVIVTTRLVSLAAVMGAILLPFFIAFYALFTDERQMPWVVFGFTIVLSAVVVLLHRANIKRLIAGAETKA